MRKRVHSILAVCVVVSAAATYQVFRISTPSNRSKLERLAAYDLKDGKREAEADLARGCPRWISYGGPAFDVGPSTLVLKRRLGVRRDHIAFCAVSGGAERYASEYNRVIFGHLTSLHGGRLVLDELHAADIYPPMEVQDNQTSEPAVPGGRGSR